MDMIVAFLAVLVVVASVSIPLTLSPLATLAGLVTGISFPIVQVHVFMLSLLVLSITAFLIAAKVTCRRAPVPSRVGGIIGLALLALFSASMIGSAAPSSFFSLLDVHRSRILSPGMLWLLSYMVYFAAKSARGPAHTVTAMIHLTVSGLAIMSTATWILTLIEAARPLNIAMLVAERTETEYFVRPIVDSAEVLLDSVGISYSSLHVYCSVAIIGMLMLGYGLTGPGKYHCPATPHTLAFLVCMGGYTILELFPLVAIVVLRNTSHFVFGSAFLDTLRENNPWVLVAMPWKHFWHRVAVRKECLEASTYGTWLQAQQDLSSLEGREAWRTTDESQDYEAERVSQARAMLFDELMQARSSGDPHALVELLRSMVNRDFANINSPYLYQHTGVGTKTNIEEFLNEVCAALREILRYDWGAAMDSTAKRELVEALQHSLGRTALCLSGGGALAMFHIGLAVELLHEDLLPEIISGSSGGSIVAGVLACCTKEELLDEPGFIAPDKVLVVQESCKDPATGNVIPWFDDTVTMLHRLVTKGTLLDRNQFLAVLRPFCGDLTFKEAFQKTGRLVNISVSTKELGEALLLNHINAPDVLVRSAVQCSCALNGVMAPGPLLAKGPRGTIEELNSAGVKFRDGSFQHDIPTNLLSVQFQAHHFIVSQVNPFISNVLSDSTRSSSVFQALQSFLLVDVRCRLKKYADLELLPLELHEMAKQEFIGRPRDITVSPNPNLCDLTYRVLSQPTQHSMRHFVREGKRMVWPHLRRIALQTQVERTLAKAARELGMERSKVSGAFVA